MFSFVFQHVVIGHTSTGPVGNLWVAIRNVKCEWTSPMIITHHSGCTLNLLDTNLQSSHDLRDCLRQMVWNEKAFVSREDMCDASPDLLDYQATVALVRSLQTKAKQGCPGAANSLMHLRTLLTGSIHSQERLVKGKQATSAVCPFCKMDTESVEHIFLAM